MAMTVNNIASQCDIQPQRVLRYIKSSGLENSLIKTNKPYLVPDSVARKVIEHFTTLGKSEQIQEKEESINEPASSDNTDYLEHLKDEVAYLRQQLDVKDNQIEELNKRLETVSNSLAESNKALSAAHAAIAIAEKQKELIAASDNEVIETQPQVKEKRGIFQALKDFWNS